MSDGKNAGTNSVFCLQKALAMSTRLRHLGEFKSLLPRENSGPTSGRVCSTKCALVSAEGRHERLAVDDQLGRVGVEGTEVLL